MPPFNTLKLSLAVAAVCVTGACNTKPAPASAPAVAAPDASALKLIVERNNLPAGTLKSGADLRTGDKVRFMVDVKERSSLVLVSIDPNGVARPHVPPDGDGLTLAPGEGIQLPGFMQLDATVGPHRFIAVLCPKPTTVTEVMGKAAAAAVNGAKNITSLGTGCDEQMVLAERR